MNPAMQQQLDELRAKGIALLKWVEFCNSPYAGLIIGHFDSRIASARAEYSGIDPSKPGAPVDLARMQGREFETSQFVSFLRDVENMKKTLDDQIRVCEARVKELSGGRGVDPIIEPSER